MRNLNENRQRLLELCSAFHLCLADTYFAGSMSSKVTWLHPRSRRCHQFDHVIVRRGQLNEVSHCRSMHSADCNTDDALVRCKLALRARKFHPSRSRLSPSIDCPSTKDPVKIKRFQTLFCNHLNSSFPAPKDHEGAWTEFRTAVTDSAVIAFGSPSKMQPDWFRDSADLLLPALEAKCKAGAMVFAHDTCNARLRLTTAKRDMQRLTRAALHRYWTNLSQRIQCCADTGDLHGMYQGIKEAIGPTSKKSATVLSEDGRPISDPGKQPFAGQITSAPSITKMYL